MAERASTAVPKECNWAVEGAGQQTAAFPYGPRGLIWLTHDVQVLLS